MKKSILVAAGTLLAVVGQGASAQLTATIGAEYTEGKYGTPDRTEQWTYPLMFRYETGPLTLRLNVPYVEVRGTVRRDTGGSVSATPRTERGLGDVTGSAFYNLVDSRRAAVGMDLGLKIKFATADKSKTLLTTGETDYSLQADFYKNYGNTTPFATLGWTRKGDPTGINFRNPFYGSVGASFKLSDRASAGLAYDYREKLLSGSKPISEASLFATYKLTGNWKAQVYGLAGLSDGSPDWGLGGTLGYTY